MEKVKQRWRYKDQRQKNLRINIEDNKSHVKFVLAEKKSKPLTRGRSKVLRSDAVKYGHLPKKNPSRYSGNDE